MKWLRDNLFSSWLSALVTIGLLLLLLKAIPPLVEWAFLDAVWRADSNACRAGEGACWGFIGERYRFILFGTYPYEQHWRPAVSTLLLLSLWIFSLVRAFWRQWLALVWLAGLAAIAILMWGGGWPRSARAKRISRHPIRSVSTY